jgi:hypothetical protein
VKKNGGGGGGGCGYRNNFFDQSFVYGNSCSLQRAHRRADPGDQGEFRSLTQLITSVHSQIAKQSFIIFDEEKGNGRDMIL